MNIEGSTVKAIKKLSSDLFLMNIKPPKKNIEKSVSTNIMDVLKDRMATAKIASHEAVLSVKSAAQNTINTAKSTATSTAVNVNVNVNSSVTIANVMENIPDSMTEVIKSRTGFGYTMNIYIGPSEPSWISVDDPADKKIILPSSGTSTSTSTSTSNSTTRPSSALSTSNALTRKFKYGNTFYQNENQQPNQVSGSQTKKVKRNNSKTITLPYANMMVSPIAQNKHRLSAIDKQRYKDITLLLTHSGHDKRTLTVTRIDPRPGFNMAPMSKGWDFELQLKAYYNKDSIGTHHQPYDFVYKNEESAITVRLRPKQKIRVVPKALIFKEECVAMTNSRVEVKAKRTPAGKIQGGFKGLGQTVRNQAGNSNLRSTTTVSGSGGGSGSGSGSVGLKELQVNNTIDMAEYTHIGGSNTHANQSNQDPNTNLLQSNSIAILTFGWNLNRPSTPDTTRGHGYGFNFPSTSPTKVLHLSLGEYGNKIVFRRGTCLATSPDVDVYDSGSFLEGLGPARARSSFQSLVGHGDVFLIAGTSMKKIVLKEPVRVYSEDGNGHNLDDSIAIRENCLIAYTQDVKSEFQQGEIMGKVTKGMVPVRVLTGPGIVWLNYTNNAGKSGFHNENGRNDMNEVHNNNNKEKGAMNTRMGGFMNGTKGSESSSGSARFAPGTRAPSISRQKSGSRPRSARPRPGSRGNGSGWSDDMSFVSMDPTVREPIDWDNDDTFSVESSNILDNSVVGLEPVKEQLIKEQEAVKEQTNGDSDYDDDISEVYLETVLEQDSEVDGHDDDEGVIDDDADDLVDDAEEEIDAVEVEVEVQMKGEATTKAESAEDKDMDNANHSDTESHWEELKLQDISEVEDASTVANASVM